MPSSGPRPPLLPKGSGRAVEDDVERALRGPTYIQGRSRRWRVSEGDDGCLCVEVVDRRTGRFVAATFNATTGRWSPP